MSCAPPSSPPVGVARAAATAAPGRGRRHRQRRERSGAETEASGDEDDEDAGISLEEQQSWAKDAKRMIEEAGDKPRKAVVALADFGAETEVDLGVASGEKLCSSSGRRLPRRGL